MAGSALVICWSVMAWLKLLVMVMAPSPLIPTA